MRLPKATYLGYPETAALFRGVMQETYEVGRARGVRLPADTVERIYARIANRVIPAEYAQVSAKSDALYGQPPELPADHETTGMARLRREAHARMPGNGLCGRPAELDCAFESICETCTFFQTSIAFRPVLQAQHDDAVTRRQDHRGQLFASLLARVGQDAS